MGRRREPMQDVELVDVATDLPLAPRAEDPEAEAAHARRLARRRRALRRWWPVPLVAALAVGGTQLVLDAQQDGRVAARQGVTGVLRTVDPGLPAAHRYDQETASVVLSGIAAGDLRVGVATPPWDAARELVALDRDGTQAWSVSLEDGTRPEPDVGMEYPTCVADAEPVATVRCLVLDRGPADTGDDSGTWSPAPPSAARLVTVDAASGALVAARQVAAMSGWGGAGGVQVLASVADGTLRVSAWDTADDRTGPDDPGAAPLWRTDVPLDDPVAAERLFYPPGVAVTPERVVVQGELGSWAFAADDGRLQASGPEYLSVSRTGHLISSGGDGARLLDDDGALLTDLPGQPLWLSVDDGSVPGVELVATSGAGGRALAGVEAESGRTLWTAPHPRWTDPAAVLLEGVLYGADTDGIWAVDVATGRERWRTDVEVAGEGTSVMTDGRHLLVLARPDALTPLGLTVGDAPTATGEPGDPAATSPAARALAAFTLEGGDPVWATRLPPDVQGVWPYGRDLLGYGDTDVVVLN